MIEKTVNAEAKAYLQSNSKTRRVDSMYLKRYKTTKMETGETIKDTKKKKSPQILPGNLSRTHPSIKLSKKDNGCQEEYQSLSNPASGVNATKVAKKYKDKDKTKDLSHIKCYNCN